MCGKRLSILLVVLLAVCSCAWALPGAKKTSQIVSVELIEPTQESTSEVLPQSSQSGTTAASTSSENSVPVSEVKVQDKKTETVKESENLSQSSEQNSKTAVSTEKLNELLTLLEKSNFILGADKIDTIKQTVEQTVEEISYDLELNNALISAQNGQIESLKKELKATRFFVDAGVAFGFKDKGVTYGVVGDMGLKLGKGFLTKVGVQYMLGDLSDIKNLEWNLENMTVSATVGWEW